jgi:metal-responsive CopG/Arc/MetJ family transcriptional regulator
MVNQRLRQRITISLDKDALETLSSIASENDVSIARVIRYAVDNLLKEWKEGRQDQLQLILPLGRKKEVQQHGKLG